MAHFIPKPGGQPRLVGRMGGVIVSNGEKSPRRGHRPTPGACQLLFVAVGLDVVAYGEVKNNTLPQDQFDRTDVFHFCTPEDRQPVRQKLHFALSVCPC